MLKTFGVLISMPIEVLLDQFEHGPDEERRRDILRYRNQLAQIYGTDHKNGRSKPTPCNDHA